MIKNFTLSTAGDIYASTVAGWFKRQSAAFPFSRFWRP